MYTKWYICTYMNIRNGLSITTFLSNPNRKYIYIYIYGDRERGKALSTYITYIYGMRKSQKEVGK